MIVDWSDLKYAQKQMVVARIMQKMRIKARPSEVFQHLVAMKTTRAYKEPKKKSDTLKRTAATVGGAYVGSKVIPKLTKGKLGLKDWCWYRCNSRLLGKWQKKTLNIY